MYPVSRCVMVSGDTKTDHAVKNHCHDEREWETGGEKRTRERERWGVGRHRERETIKYYCLVWQTWECGSIKPWELKIEREESQGRHPGESDL